MHIQSDSTTIVLEPYYQWEPSPRVQMLFVSGTYLQATASLS